MLNNGKINATVKPRINPIELYNLDLERFGKNLSSPTHEMCVTLPENIAMAMAQMGWRVKWTKDDPERGWTSHPYIKVSCSWRFFTPQVNLKLPNGQLIPYDESSIGKFDNMALHINRVVLSGSTKQPDDDGVWRYSAYVSELEVENRGRLVFKDGQFVSQ